MQRWNVWGSKEARIWSWWLQWFCYGSWIQFKWFRASLPKIKLDIGLQFSLELISAFSFESQADDWVSSWSLTNNWTSFWYLSVMFEQTHANEHFKARIFLRPNPLFCNLISMGLSMLRWKLMTLVLAEWLSWPSKALPVASGATVNAHDCQLAGTS